MKKGCRNTYTLGKFLTAQIPKFSVAKRKLRLISFFYIKPSTFRVSEKNGFPDWAARVDTKQRLDVEKCLSSLPHSHRL